MSAPATDPPTTPQEAGPKSSRSRILVAGLGVLAVGIVVAAFLIGRSSAGAGELRTDLASANANLEETRDEVSRLESENSELESSVSELEGENSELEERVATLKKSVAAANGLKTDSAGGGSAAAPEGSNRMGVAAQVGDVILKPTALVKAGSAYVVTIVAKNQGSSSVDIFCGGDGASLTDTSGRTFDGDAVLADDTANCGDSLQPGLTATYKMKFKVPGAAKAAYVSLWDSSNFDGAEEAVHWAA